MRKNKKNKVKTKYQKYEKRFWGKQQLRKWVDINILKFTGQGYKASVRECDNVILKNRYLFVTFYDKEDIILTKQQQQLLSQRFVKLENFSVIDLQTYLDTVEQKHTQK